jgi:hypothetical protein
LGVIAGVGRLHCDGSLGFNSVELRESPRSGG